MSLPLPDRPFEIEIFLDRHKGSAAIDLASSGIDSLALNEVLALASDDQRRRFFHTRLDYPRHQGAPELVEAIARCYDDAVKSADIAVTSGAQEAIYIALTALLTGGGNAVVVVPGYHSVTAIAEQHVEVRHVSLDAASDFRLSLDSLFDATDDETVLIALNFPNNPTGGILSESALYEVVSFCRKRGIWLLCDEVYRGAELEPSSQLPSVAEVYERGLVVDGLSKRFGIAGARIGWIACCDRNFLERCRTLRSYLSVCSSRVGEIIAEIVLDAQLPIDHVRNRARSNIRHLREFADANPTILRIPRGGIAAFAFLETLPVLSDMFWRLLLDETGVLVLPGFVFNQGSLSYDKHFRVNLVRDHSAEGVSRLLDFLATNDST